MKAIRLSFDIIWKVSALQCWKLTMAKARKIVSKTRVSLIVLDIVMPDVEGLQTISHLRREEFRGKILAVSGASRARDYLRVASVFGADAIIEKIQPISEVLRLIPSLVGDEQATDQACLEASGRAR